MATLKITKKHHKHINNPFPSSPKSTLFLEGQLVFDSQAVPSNQIYSIGQDFQLNWSSKDGGFVSISPNSQPTKHIWSTIPGQAFVSAAVAETEVEESRGSFVIKDKNVHLVCDHQTIEYINVVQNGADFDDLDTDDHDFASFLEEMGRRSDQNGAMSPAVIIGGKLISRKKKKKREETSRNNSSYDMVEECSTYVRYWIMFDQRSSHEVGFHVRLGKPNVEIQLRVSPRFYRGFYKKLSAIRRRRVGWLFKKRRSLVTAEDENVAMKAAKCQEFNRIWLTCASEKSERFFGFGEQFSHMDFKGKRVPILVQEQGIGRGDQPITFAANLVSYRAGGDWSTTYAPSPFYMTSKMKSLYLEGYNYSVFDMTKHDRVQIQIHSYSVQGRIIDGDSPAEIIEVFTEAIGRPPELPEWIISGATVGMQGGTDTVRNIWNVLQNYDVPISAFWLQDWVGRRETVIGSQLWWNWEVDSTMYGGWQQLLKDLKAHDINVMTYCNPCLAPMDKKQEFRRNLFEEAKELDILVKDKKGKPYMVPNTAFDVGMLDITHPSTAPWFKQILGDMVDDGVRGWMADFGEGLPVDACLYSGEDPIAAHNRYPELWAKVNREFVEEWRNSHLINEGEDQENGLVFFMRAGFRGSPKWAMLFWEGDQMVSWQANDGIKSAVVGLLSGGLSGYALNHSDIGGYCTVNIPFFNYRRTEELLLRWMELNAFTTVFRTHEGNKPSVNSQFYSNHKTLSQFARLAKIYQAWKFYRIQLVKEASQKGLPVCRHPFIHYPHDERVHSFTYEQFLVGTEIMVVPVLDKGKEIVRAYFPMGGELCSWKHIWTGNIYHQGTEASIEAPIGNPAVFVKDGSTIGERFLKNLKDYNLL